MYRFICKRRLPVAGRWVVYRLTEQKGEYWIECRFGKERVRHSLGQSLSTASEVFEQLVSGTVTPCTLADILSDMGF